MIIPVLMYHSISNDKSHLSVSINNFDSQLEYLSKSGFNSISFNEIHKNINAGSGIGSSAASAAGAVFGINQLLGKPFSAHDLIQFAMEGEILASGSPHADNVAPVLLGGFTLVRSINPVDVIKLPCPSVN